MRRSGEEWLRVGRSDTQSSRQARTVTDRALRVTGVSAMVK